MNGCDFVFLWQMRCRHEEQINIEKIHGCMKKREASNQFVSPV
jgi:hypothetical protein